MNADRTAGRRRLPPLLAAAALLLPLAAIGQGAQTLDTASFTVRIVPHCEEGEVACNRVEYLGTSKKTGKSLRLAGSTRHAPCADGVTPCRFLGYVFRNRGVTYFVGEDGQLLVTRGDQVLVKESGTWR